MTNALVEIRGIPLPGIEFIRVKLIRSTGKSAVHVAKSSYIKDAVFWEIDQKNE